VRWHILYTVSSGEGKYRFVGVPKINFNLEVEEPGKVKRTGYINVVDRIQGISIYQGLTVPADLTVEYPKAPSAAYWVGFMPPKPEFKMVMAAPYVPVPAQKATRIFA